MAIWTEKYEQVMMHKQSQCAFKPNRCTWRVVLTDTPGKWDVFSLISALISWRSNKVLPQEGHDTYSWYHCRQVKINEWSEIRLIIWIALSKPFILTVFVFLILQPCSRLNDVFLMKSKSWSGASNRMPSPRPSTRRAPEFVPAPITKSSLPMSQKWFRYDF